MSKFPIIEVFTSIQGEGMFMGVPSVFVRVSGCNLRCIFQNSICDTPYSSFAPEKSKFTVKDVINEFVKYPNVEHLVITGGEPALYDIAGFLDEFEAEFRTLERNWPKITIETNGSLPIKPDARVHLYSISPKLSTSCVDQELLNNKDPKHIVEVYFGNSAVEIPVSQLQNHTKNRINIDILAKTIRDNFLFGSDCQLKFVWSGSECESEIKDLIGKLAKQIEEYQKSDKISGSLYDIAFPEEYLNDCVYLMPEGETEEKIRESAQEAVGVCLRNGWKYTDRLHIRIWGNTRNK